MDHILVDLASVILNGNLEAARQHVFQTAGAGTERLRRFDRIVGSSDLSADERRAIMAVTERLRSLYSTRNDIVHSPIVMAYSVEGRRISSCLTKISREGKQRDVSSPPFASMRMTSASASASWKRKLQNWPKSTYRSLTATISDRYIIL
ncbi:hypothetical protein [Sinorhizobium fredii]|uniref:hypothetical protein n=1 Tax=Rhizobium fredii TaxID=380 RepID=UPI00351222F5